MDPQRYIIAKIEPEMNETGRFPWLKFISETSLLPVADYPALLVEDEKPFGTDGVFGDGSPALKTGEYIMSLIVKTLNLKDMTRSDYRGAKNETVKRIEELQNFLAEEITLNPVFEEDGNKVHIAGLLFEESELGFVEVDSTPALILQVPVKTKYIIS